MKSQKPKLRNHITIHSNQINNPVTKSFFFNYNTSSEINCDYQIQTKSLTTIACFFLSLHYHELNPTYLSTRFTSSLSFYIATRKYLFLLYDITASSKDVWSVLDKKDFQIALNALNLPSESDNIFQETKRDFNKESSTTEQSLTDINMLCIENNVTLILCFSGDEMAQYLHAVSQMEEDEVNINKSKVIIKKGENCYNIGNEEMITAICCIDNINKTDAGAILTSYCTIKDVANAKTSELKGLNKWTENKVDNIINFFNYEIS